MANIRDGRALVVRLLCRMEKLNGDDQQDLRASREVLHRGLSEYCQLSPQEQRRFVSVLNDFIGMSIAGAPIAAKFYRRKRIEGITMGISTRFLNSERGRALTT